jgi:hypothetical protein
MYTIILFGRTMVNQKVEESVLKSKLMAGRTKLRVVRVLQLQQHRRIGLWAQAERACLFLLLCLCVITCHIIE